MLDSERDGSVKPSAIRARLSARDNSTDQAAPWVDPVVWLGRHQTLYPNGLCKNIHRPVLKMMTLLERIHNGSTAVLPVLEMPAKFLRYVEEDSDPYAWAVYLFHDACHDHPGFQDDRNTLIAFHRQKGIWRILGREIPRALALELVEMERS